MNYREDSLGDEDVEEISPAPVEKKKKVVKNKKVEKKTNPAPSNEGRNPKWPKGYNGRAKERVLNDGHDWKDFFSEEDE